MRPLLPPEWPLEAVSEERLPRGTGFAVAVMLSLALWGIILAIAAIVTA